MSAKPYADRLFRYHELGRLSDAAARAALIGPASTLNLNFEEAAARATPSSAISLPWPR
jgi:hypothetical protein